MAIYSQFPAQIGPLFFNSKKGWAGNFVPPRAGNPVLSGREEEGEGGSREASFFSDKHRRGGGEERKRCKGHPSGRKEEGRTLFPFPTISEAKKREEMTNVSLSKLGFPIFGIKKKDILLV